MSQDKKRPPKMTRTTQHLSSPRFRERQIERLPSGFLPPEHWHEARHLWTATHKRPYNAEEFAHRLDQESFLTQRFVDASLFDVKTPARLWESLFSRVKGITIIPSVRRELEPWARTHPEHRVAQAILLKDGALDIREYDSWGAEDAAVFDYYVHLLGVRKYLFLMAASQFKSQHGREPEAAELDAVIHKNYGSRGHLLAKKGAEAPTSLTDESLVYTAVASAVRSGNPVHILTKDEDIQEQFWKMIWLLTNHYRGMHLAKAYAADPGKFEVLPMPIDHPAFNSTFECADGLLIRKSVALSEILPPAFTPVEIRCSIVGDLLTEMTFTADRDMAELLVIKGKTRGLNTDLFGGVNCQTDLASMNIPKTFSNCAALAREHRIPLPNSESQISVLDTNQALYCRERVVSLV